MKSSFSSAKCGTFLKLSSKDRRGLEPLRQFPVILNCCIVLTGTEKEILISLLDKEFELKFKLTIDGQLNFRSRQFRFTVFYKKFGGWTVRCISNPQVKVQLFPRFEKQRFVTVLHLAQLE